MKKINSLLLAFSFLVSVMLFGAGTGHAQETMMKKVGDTGKTVANKTVSGTKTGWKRGRRIGHTIGTRTWTGTKWIATKSWKGGRWVARKTVSGTRWVYYKARGTAKKRV